MRLTELLREDLIQVGLEATNKWEAIEELVDLLISTHELRLTDRDEVVNAVFTRERSLSTGLEHGLAVPHGAVNCVDEIIACMGTSRVGIPFESLDGKPAHLIVLLVIPKGRFQRHVRTLAGIASLGLKADMRERVFNAETPEEVMDVIYDVQEADDEE